MPRSKLRPDDPSVYPWSRQQENIRPTRPGEEPGDFLFSSPKEEAASILLLSLLTLREVMAPNVRISTPEGTSVPSSRSKEVLPDLILSDLGSEGPF